MSRIPRVFQKLFASAAGAQQIGQFGSLANNTPTYVTDIVAAMSASNWLTGWYGAVVGANSPALQDLNAVPFVLSQQIAEILQDGIPPWETNTVYYKGSLATAATGIAYVSLTDANTGNVVTDATHWWPMTSPAAPSVVVGNATYCTHATLDAAIADSATPTNANVYVATSYTAPNSATALTKSWRIYGAPGVTITAGGSSSILSARADGVEFHNLRLSGFTTAIGGTAAWTYGQVAFCRFATCTTAVDTSSCVAGKIANVTAPFNEV